MITNICTIKINNKSQGVSIILLQKMICKNLDFNHYSCHIKELLSVLIIQNEQYTIEEQQKKLKDSE